MLLILLEIAFLRGEQPGRYFLTMTMMGIKWLLVIILVDRESRQGKWHGAGSWDVRGRRGTGSGGGRSPPPPKCGGSKCQLLVTIGQTGNTYNCSCFTLLRKKTKGKTLNYKIAQNLCYWKRYDVTKTLWHHYFLGNANQNKPIRQFFATECTLPLGICSIKERWKLPEF